MPYIKWVCNGLKKKKQYRHDYFTKETMEKVHTIHQSIPGYVETPLYSLNGLANELNINKVWIKDEAPRLNISSFKVLGGSCVVANVILKQLQKKVEWLKDYEQLHVKNTGLKTLKFATATDGNHGRGIAWAANWLGYEAVIFMPKGSSQSRVDNIKKLGATVEVTDCNYDDTVRIAADFAEENNYEMVQDTLCKGCTEPPIWIMQGYLTIIREILGQIEGEKPTHIFLQAGVGAFAGAIAAILADIYTVEELPKIVVVEAENSDCFYQSIKNNKVTHVTGDLDTIMVGLACGEPSPLAWEILSNTADVVVACSNAVAARGMRVLGNPIQGDARIRSGESGAVPLGLVSALGHCEHPLRKELNITEKSKILLVNTEGITDPEMYKRVVWNGEFTYE